MSEIIQLKYTKKQLRLNLIYALALFLIFVGYRFIKPDSYFGYGYLATGFILVLLYFFKKYYHYATIKEGKFIKHGLYSKVILLSEIKEVIYYNGEYKLITPKRTVKINTLEIDKTSTAKLKALLDQLKNTQ